MGVERGGEGWFTTKLYTRSSLWAPIICVRESVGDVHACAVDIVCVHIHTLTCSGCQISMQWHAKWH